MLIQGLTDFPKKHPAGVEPGIKLGDCNAGGEAKTGVFGSLVMPQDKPVPPN